MARVMVILFTVFVLGVGAAIGSVVLGDDTPLIGPLVVRVTNPTGPVDPADQAARLFTVPSGATAVSIGQDLERQDLIRSALAFRLVVEQTGVGGNLTAGDYEIRRSMSTQEIVELLASGNVKRGIIVTIPEGWRALQIADRLESTGFASGEEFMRAVADPRSVPASALLGEPLPPTLEGYLFPETYESRERVSGVQAADLMVRMFAQRVGDQARRAQADPPLTQHEVLTLASIVEREAKVPAERSTIASVYLNRLAIDMLLQADPTVQYAVANADPGRGASYGYWKPILTDADLALTSPFNTYATPGLPPGPICNPGVAAILATLNPARTDYLYFVAADDGSHLFSRTLAEHNDNIARLTHP